MVCGEAQSERTKEGAVEATQRSENEKNERRCKGAASRSLLSVVLSSFLFGVYGYYSITL